MLVIDPDLRISAAEALKTPYVSWKNHMDELSSPPKGHYDARMENVSFSIDEWKSNFEKKFVSRFNKPF